MITITGAPLHSFQHKDYGVQFYEGTVLDLDIIRGMLNLPLTLPGKTFNIDISRKQAMALANLFLIESRFGVSSYYNMMICRPGPLLWNFLVQFKKTRTSGFGRFEQDSGTPMTGYYFSLDIEGYVRFRIIEVNKPIQYYSFHIIDIEDFGE